MEIPITHYLLIEVSMSFSFRLVLADACNSPFSLSNVYNIGGRPYSATLANWRNHKELDIVLVLEQSSNATVLPGNGDGTFQTQSYKVGRRPRSAISTDFNNDNKQDLAVTYYLKNTISVLLDNGNGAFQAQIRYNVGSGPKSILAADLNNDKKNGFDCR